MSAEEGEGELSTPSWIFWAMANVCGGLRAVIDIVWQWGQVPLRSVPMDTLNTLLLGWLFFGVFMVVLAKFLYGKFLTGDHTDEDDNEFSHQEGESNERDPKLPVEGPPPPPPVVTRKATIVPEGLPEHVSAPMSTGGDPDAVKWINNVMVWFFEGTEGGPIIREMWNDNLNEHTVGAALETGVLIEILEFLPQTPGPTLSNVIVDCAPTDDIMLTCDVNVTLYLRVQVTRTRRDVTTESEYACAVRPLRGRLCADVKTHECAAFVRLEGWPEVNMTLEGVRNNAEGLDELQVQEVLKEELTAALRKVALDLTLAPTKTCPRFARSRAPPDHVIPVGYDALVRERQTHPPSFEAKIPSSRTPTPCSRPAKRVVDPAPPTAAAPPSFGPVFGGDGGAPFATLSKGTELLVGSETTAKILSVSEESLVRRNLERYIEDYARGGEEEGEGGGRGRGRGEKPSHSGRSPTRVTNPPPSPPSPSLPPRAHTPLSRLSMVFSSREKPIDEPGGKGGVTPPMREEEEGEEEEMEEEEKEEVVEQTHSEGGGGGKAHSLFPGGGALLARSPSRSPSRSPAKEFEFLKETLKEGLKKSPFSKGGRGTPSTAAPSLLTPAVGIIGLNGKRLLVKVVKATGLGGDAGVSASYVVIEMDDPPQKFSTSVLAESSPFWDEQFLFDLSDNTLELLFEIYDQAGTRFLGLGIVGIEELVATPSQRQIIPLQARPYEKDEVSGSLTCEFLFLDRADLPDLNLRKSTAAQNATIGGKLKTTTKTYVKPSEERQGEEGGVCSSSVTEAALKDLEERHHQGTLQTDPNTRSTLIIHASRKPVPEPNDVVENEDADVDETGFKPGVSLGFGTGKATSATHQKSPSTGSSAAASNAPPSNTVIYVEPAAEHRLQSLASVVGSNGLDSEEDRGRTRSRRKRDFFGSLRRRFSRSKLRSKSVDPAGAGDVLGGVAGGVDGRLDGLDPPVGAGRSVSMERSTGGGGLRSRGKSGLPSPTSPDSQIQRLLTVPLSRSRGGRSTPSFGGMGSGDSGSTRSSLSGTSGLSSASTKTYINEASLLVVETLENGIIKHYLVPLSLQRKNKWRKKGTKLHVFNEHTFIAKHLPSSTPCQVCQKSVGRRLGKQGYECRDCSFQCHKPCHVKTDVICPNSTVNSMDLVYVKDERAERRKRGALS